MRSVSVEVSVRGKWLRVPAVEVNGQHVVATGQWIRTASIHDEFWLERGVGDPQPYIDSLKANGGVKADLFTFAQRIPDVTPRHPFPMERESVAVINLDDAKAWWENLPQETRKNVRRAGKRGVTTTISRLTDDLVRAIVAINNESPIRQGKPFCHYGKPFEAVRKDYSSFRDRSEFVCAHWQDEIIGFIQLVYMRETATILEILTCERHYDKRPANLLIAKAVEHCAAQGIAYLTYGRYQYGNKGTNNPLTEFKRRNGFEEALLPRYYVPLTLRGRVSVAFNLHRGVLGMLPERVIAPVLSLRRTWYRATESQRST